MPRDILKCVFGGAITAAQPEFARLFQVGFDGAVSLCFIIDHGNCFNRQRIHRATPDSVSPATDLSIRTSSESGIKHSSGRLYAHPNTVAFGREGPNVTISYTHRPRQFFQNSPCFLRGEIYTRRSAARTFARPMP